MQTKPDVIIIGGGLAGLASGIHIAGHGIPVTIIEKAPYPRHKVCGEYISNEIRPYLKWLDIDISALRPAEINKLSFSSFSGEPIDTLLPLGGFGVSRYVLDDYLFRFAEKKGCRIMSDTVTDVTYRDNKFQIKGKAGIYAAAVVLGAYGKRSVIDQSLNREFINKKSPWLAVKAHYKGDIPEDTVGLHHFPGGYCGVSKIEDGSINICYLSDYKSFKKYKNIEDYQKQVVCKNPRLREIFYDCELLFERPITISQISFERKNPVDNHILMIGDTAGLIHPLCGNGMAMALHSAKIASEKVIHFVEEKITRHQMERDYAKEWNSNFARRLRVGRMLGNILERHGLTKVLLSILRIFPSILPLIVKQTHGKPVNV